MPVAQRRPCRPQWVAALADVARAIARRRAHRRPRRRRQRRRQGARRIAAGRRAQGRSCWATPRRTTPAPQLLALANWIGEQTGASVGYLTEAANTVGAQLVGACRGGGLNAGQMLRGGLKAVLLLNNEPVFDSAAGAASQASRSAQMVVTLSPFKANLEFSDVLLPIAPFTETPGHLRQCRRRVAELPRRRQAAGRDASGLEGAARAGQSARPAGLRFRIRRRRAGRSRGRRAARAGAKLATRPRPHRLGDGAKRPGRREHLPARRIVRRAPSLQLTADARRRKRRARRCSA
jgi:NADH-quinone oxidoreductase subunit G